MGETALAVRAVDVSTSEAAKTGEKIHPMLVSVEPRDAEGLAVHLRDGSQAFPARTKISLDFVRGSPTVSCGQHQVKEPTEPSGTQRNS